MKIYSMKNFSFSYQNSEVNAIEDISFEINEGEYVVICGPSGSGKSTFLKQLKLSMCPNGTKKGTVKFRDKNIEEYGKEIETMTGYVGQYPAEQIVTDKVWHELAFGLENLGMDSDVIRRRVAETSQYFGMQNWLYEDTDSLSGGQKQLLLLASVMVMQPQVLLLDEPVSELDPVAAKEFLEILNRVHSELGLTIILCEHRIENVFEVCDRIVLFNEGRIAYEGTAQSVCESVIHKKDNLIKLLPVWVRIGSELYGTQKYPATSFVKGREYISEYNKEYGSRLLENVNSVIGNETAIELKEVWFRYSDKERDIIKGLNINVKKGEIYVVLGGNGSGKSTMLGIINGMKKPLSGNAFTAAPCVLLPQNPRTLFTESTLIRDMKAICNDEEKVNEMLESFHIKELSDRNIYDVSGGELMRAALAKVLLLEPEILLLDEPTKGLDDSLKTELAQMLLSLKENGMTILMVSHDVEFAAAYSDRCALFFDGRVVSVDNSHTFFANNCYYTTIPSRLTKNIVEDVVTEQDIYTAFDIKQTKTQKLCVNKREQPDTNACSVSVTEKGHVTSLLSIIILFLLVPVTVWSGVYIFDDRKYLFISLLVMTECLIPLYAAFEKRKKQTREIVLIAVFVALCVASRVLFYMLPEVKPVMAMVIISGVAFGADTGFFIGSTTMLVSNIYFGEGPWTPWQMLAMGLTGYFAGLLFRKKSNRAMLVLYGIVASLVIYGAIMNLSTAVFSCDTLTLKGLIPFYAAGIPTDILRGAATAVFLFIFSKSIISSTERVFEKYR